MVKRIKKFKNNYLKFKKNNSLKILGFIILFLLLIVIFNLSLKPINKNTDKNPGFLNSISYLVSNPVYTSPSPYPSSTPTPYPSSTPFPTPSSTPGTCLYDSECPADIEEIPGSNRCGQDIGEIPVCDNQVWHDKEDNYCDKTDFTCKKKILQVSEVCLPWQRCSYNTCMTIMGGCEKDSDCKETKCYKESGETSSEDVYDITYSCENCHCNYGGYSIKNKVKIEDCGENTLDPPTYKCDSAHETISIQTIEETIKYCDSEDLKCKSKIELHETEIECFPDRCDTATGNCPIKTNPSTTPTPYPSSTPTPYPSPTYTPRP
ncbi:MAG: hypothetical protein PHF67_01350 [Candidatus Nanoarchaeia archaeon]|nr:hypothetical protein [Candidatus Nanoarchaeia archaeon]